MKILGVCVLAMAGYSLYQWFMTASGTSPPIRNADPRIIPLTLPPKRADSATMPTATASPMTTPLPPAESAEENANEAL